MCYKGGAGWCLPPFHQSAWAGVSCAGPIFFRLLFLESRIVGRDALSANIPRDHVHARAGDFIGTHVCWHYNRKFRIRRSLNRSLQFFLTVTCAVERSNCIPTAKRGVAPEIQGRWMLGWMLRRARRHQGRHHQIPAHKRERGGVAEVHYFPVLFFLWGLWCALYRLARLEQDRLVELRFDF